MSGYKVAACDLAAIDLKYLCSSCGWVLRDAVQLHCGTHYCETCLPNMQRHNNPVCFRCGESLANIESFPDNFIRREILSFNVTCLNKDDGCDWHGELRLSDAHHDTCQFRPLSCRNNGCTDMIPACKLIDHEGQECAYHPVVCEHCNAPETLGSLQNHLTTCPSVLVECTTCGKENIPRNQLKCHTDPLNGDCPRKPCPFRGYGCVHPELMNEEDLNLHLSEKEHLLLLLHLVEVTLHQNGEEPHPQVGGIGQALQLTLEDHKWALTTHYHWLATLGEDVKKLFDVLAAVGDRVEVVYGMVAELKQENTELKLENTELKNRIAALEARANSRDDHDNRMNRQAEVSRTLQASLLRQLQELSCQNEVQYGELVWQITGVLHKCAEARDNPEHSILSPPFYTSRIGYKVCMRLYMNGRGREWKSNMSFFFVLMKGEYDGILQWPFSCRVELRVLGQGDRRGDDAVVSFRPDPQSSSFVRPACGMNVADDVPQCALPLDIFRRGGGYVENDTMFVKVVLIR